MLRSGLCDYSNTYVVVNRKIGFLAAAANENDKAQKVVVFKNNASFRSCIPKVNRTLIYNPEDLDVVVPMYNLLEYIQICQNYFMTSGTLWNYYRDEIDGVDENASDGKSQ